MCSSGIAGIFKLEPRREVVAVASRRGAAKLALEHGYTIHPGYLLGNTAAYHVWHDSSGLLERLSRALRVSLMLFWGRAYLPVPFRTPISFVFGTPVRPPPRAAAGAAAAAAAAAGGAGGRGAAAAAATPGLPPSKEAIEALHQAVLREVRAIYEAVAPSYGWGDRPLVFV